MSDLSGSEVRIPFYITQGNGLLLLGNEIIHRSYQLGPENLLVIPKRVRGLSEKQFTFQTYTEPTQSGEPNAVHSHLLVVPSKTASFATYFSVELSLTSVQSPVSTHKKRFQYGKIAQRFANKLHGYYHLSLPDMTTLCRRGGVMTPVLKQALEKDAKKCTSCKEICRPLQSRKISFHRILTSFNHHVQLDFFFCAEYDNQTIFHMVHVHTAYSAASLMPSREMSQVAQQLEVKWINVHGAPLTMSGGVEFFNTRFSDALSYFDIKFEPRPA